MVGVPSEPGRPTAVALACGGTGGHVFPALAVAEQLTRQGAEVIVFGGDRMEADAVPAAGYELIQVPIRGLQRSLSLRNLSLPFVVLRAIRSMRKTLKERGVGVVLGTGGYVTGPAVVAARMLGIPAFVQEQNAHAGLANRIAGTLARKTFTSFPETQDAVRPDFVGNPVRAAIAEADYASLGPEARAAYGLDPRKFTIGIVGGSLGSRPVNQAMIAATEGLDVQVVHLTGARFEEEVRNAIGDRSDWVVVGFEDRMEQFFAVADLVVSRASGMVSEITVSATPSILIPGEFGSKGHQAASARVLDAAGASVMITEDDLSERLRPTLISIIENANQHASMVEAARALGRPDAAARIAKELLDAV